MTGLGEVARQMLFGRGRAVSESDVVTVVLLVGAGHCGGPLVMGLVYVTHDKTRVKVQWQIIQT